MKRLFAIFFTLLAFAIKADASHIVGGEVTYKCLGGGNYQVSVSIYEDCLTGDPEAIAEDNPAFIGIFDGQGFQQNFFYPSPFDSIYASQVTVPANFSNACINNAPSTCLKKRTFTKIYHLPDNNSGYIIVYQRCCRNASIINIVNPSEVGATYFCIIPPANKAICNNSAVFNNYPPQIICINNPLIYDHSAFDADGDSLSYEFCDTYVGGSDQDAKPNPSPPIPNGPPYYDTVIYKYPFSHLNPMGGYPQIKIDPNTGLITGTPNLIGRFVVTVCCHEWRNHQIINTVTREFQFVVTNCSKSVVADIPQYSSDFNTYIVDCEDYTVNFVNNSIGGFSYHWDFGVNGVANDTSSEFQPTFVYPDTGTYVVKLVVNPHTTCTDSISRLVKVYPKFKATYMYQGLQCPGSPITFTDLSSSTFKPITEWDWNFGDGGTAYDSVVTHTYTQGGTYNVSLISKNIRGCTDTLLKRITIDNFRPFAGNDTTIVKGSSIDFNATGGTQYLWAPSTYLNDTTINDPVGYYPDTGRFTYVLHVVSPFGCQGNDSVTVYVVNQAAFFMPTAFTPNGDGKNDYFHPVVIGYASVKYFRIFNRWGQLVYETKNIGDGGWNGTFHGQKCELGTYYWELNITDRNGKEKTVKGDVELLR